MFSLFTMNILHWKVELNNGKGTALLPQINSPTHTHTHTKTTDTHSSPLTQKRLSEVKVYTEHLGEVKG